MAKPIYTSLATPFVESVLAEPLKAEIARLTDYRDIADERIYALTKLLQEITGSQPAAAKIKTRRKKHTRRSVEEVKKQAHDMLADIKAAGKGGISGKEINAKWGKVIPTIKIFIAERTGTKVKSTGARSAMRYFA